MVQPCPHVRVLTHAHTYAYLHTPLHECCLTGSQPASLSAHCHPTPAFLSPPCSSLPLPFFLSLHILYFQIPSSSLSLNLLNFHAFLSLSSTQTSPPSLPLTLPPSLLSSIDLTLCPLPHPLPSTSSLYIFSSLALSSLRHPPTHPSCQLREAIQLYFAKR